MESPQAWLWIWTLGAPLVVGIFDRMRTPRTSIRRDSDHSDDTHRLSDRPLASSVGAR
ncbi:MAG: hypothetical protein ACK5XM_00995 [Betaproteobacteria bacterium]